MNRHLFTPLFTLPFIAIFFVTTGTYFIFIAAAYFYILQVIRLQYLQFNLKQIFLSYTPFRTNTWFTMWEKDNNIK